MTKLSFTIFYLMSIHIILIDPNCLYESKEKQCEDCKLGFKLQSNTKFPKCELDSCLNPSQDGNSCLKCYEGYTLNPQIENQTYCEPICSGFNNDANKCNYCGYGYYLKNGDCKKCEGGCVHCSFDGKYCYKCSPNLSLILTKIENDKFENEFPICQNKNCGDNCAECENNICTNCSIEFFKTNENDKDCIHCSKIIQNCLRCDYDNNEYKCNQCVQSYFTNPYGVCEKCIENCARCSNSNICEMCNPGFGFDIKIGKCVECKSKYEFCNNCGIYDKEFLCYNCDEGYIISKKNDKCLIIVKHKFKLWWLVGVCSGLALFGLIYIIYKRFRLKMAVTNVEKNNDVNKY